MTERALMHWLSGLEPAELAEVLARRPDALAVPAPGDLRALTDRLLQRTAVAEVFAEMPLPAVQLIEVMAALVPDEKAPGVERGALAGLFGRAPDDPELEATLTVLVQRALVWPDGDRLCTPEVLLKAFPRPLGLGRPARELLGQLTNAGLRPIADAYGLPAPAGKAALVAALTGALSNADLLRATVATAPETTRALLRRIASTGPEVAPEQGDLPDVAWAAGRGLLVPVRMGVFELHREAGLALRGPGWRAPFDPLPPGPSLTPVARTGVTTEASSAATALLDRLSAVLDDAAARPIARVRRGDITVREQRRLARGLGTDEATVRLAVALALAAGLLGPTADGLLPTAAYDAWRTGTPADRLSEVLAAWPGMPAAPLLPDPEESAGEQPAGRLVAELRRVLLRVVHELPPDTGVADPQRLAPLVAWAAPLAAGLVDKPEVVVEALLREATLVGACAHGAISPLGRALVEGRPVAEVAARMLGTAATRALFQADLTVVVTGTPDAELSVLLDGCADRAARGAATVWRIDAASIRRALDTGIAAVELLDRLRSVARGGVLPQPLEYLVQDIARRHGAVRIRTVGSVIVADDTALIAELATARSLRALRLVRLAPTVLASPASTVDTAAALRAAGYAPVHEDHSGAVVVERPERRRAEPPPRGTAPVESKRSTVDPVRLAEKLLNAPVPQAPPIPAQRDPLTSLTRLAPHLDDAQTALLAQAVRTGRPVRIDYVDSAGKRSSRVIESAVLNEHRIEAWCRLRGDDRAFSVAGIQSVRPA